MKKFALGCVALICVLAIVAAAAVFFALKLTQPLAERADEFLAHIAGGRVAEAYASTAKEFQAATSEARFRAFLETSSIAKAKGASWRERSIENNEGRLGGTIQTAEGGEIPVTIKFVNEGGQWRILSIEKADAGLVSPARDRGAPAGEVTAQPPALPGEELCRALARASLLALGQAINADDFGGLHNSISRLWQEQITPAQLRDVFHGFVERKVDLTPIGNLTPVFDPPPSIDPNGILVLEGSYPSTPLRVLFRVKFVKEGGDWKTFGLNVNLKGADEGAPAPSPAPSTPPAQPTH